MTEKTKALFKQYEAAFDKLDVNAQVLFFAEHFISASPKGTIAQDRDEFAKLADQAGQFYRSVGQTGATILSMTETPISNEYSLVRVHWGCTFEKTGDKPIEFDVSYLIQELAGQDPKILLFIAHEDEEKAMKELGLIAS
jgi:hypothetical protein